MKHSVLDGSGQVSEFGIKRIQICSDYTLFAVSITTTQLVPDFIRTYLIKSPITDLTPTHAQRIEHSSKYSSLVLFQVYICIRIAMIGIALIFNLIKLILIENLHVSLHSLFSILKNLTNSILKNVVSMNCKGVA